MRRAHYGEGRATGGESPREERKYDEERVEKGDNCKKL